ncbi:M1 family metallopeptidase [Sphingomonas hankyongi]|uniref:Aminopeptidase N n=1 Tax=Sphingomonas hankyongi TaxID=2908209 RepID=A0ABT0S077_9SPHN|nr:M1 family metallopeptidase [Sphingomonas hankyongi]MCL6729263.1 M1 family metallopeptidase [Sphingomonas hankyongi]
MTLLRSAFFAAAVLLAACRAGEEGNRADASPGEMTVAPILTSEDALDVSSFAKPLEARVTHVALDLGVDFDSKRIAGTATLDIDRRADAKEIVLDDKGLEIESITDGANRPLQWKVGAADPNLGSPLAVALNPDTKRLVIKYKSAPQAGALLWLTPQQTAGKKAPFLFSQGESIENRSWIPTQDSPGVRQTWEATVRVPAGMTAVMSAPRSAEPITQGGESVFSFKMGHSVAPYMIAIAVGDLAFKSLGSRTGVWAEPATLPAAANELADTEKMVDAAEKLYGPYQWGRYDVLVLPPSFPFGGMENPTLTFATPTFIAGDRSLVSLIAHELAHSWSGNLATNATWNDFWLNEGMTTYAERRIVEELYGKKVADEQIALGIDAMNKAVKDNGGPSGADTRLHLDVKGRHPDEGSSDIAYEKGAAFLRTIEANVGRERFDEWLKGWFSRHAFQPVTSKIFLDDIRQHLVKGDKGLESKLMLDRWVYEPGVPPNMVRPPAGTFAEQDQAAAAFAGGSTAPDWTKWTTDERLRFLNRLPRSIPKQRLDALQNAYDLNGIGNMEVRYAWLDLVVGNRYDPGIPSLEQFLTSQGRGKFVKPLIKALAKDGQWGRPIAERIFAQTRNFYHPMVVRDLEELKLAQPASQGAKSTAP